MFGLFTHIFLDISTAVVWWTIKKTTNGISYLIWGTSDGKKHHHRISHQVETELKAKLDTILVKNAELEEYIKKLEAKIEVLDNYIPTATSNPSSKTKI